MSSRPRWTRQAAMTAGLTVALCCLVAALPPIQPVAADVDAAAGQEHTVAAGEAVWWSGAFAPDPDDLPPPVPWVVPAQQPPRSESCDVAVPCHDHTLKVEGPVDPGSRLRVAMTNWPGYADLDEAVDLAVLLPGGGECRPTHHLAATHGAQVAVTYGFSLEAFVRPGGRGDCNREVVPGIYIVRAFGSSTDRQEPTRYHLRAALEGPVDSQSDRRLLPDLVPEAPPFGFAFGCQPGSHHIYADSPPHETTPAEHQGNGVAWERTCLRYAFTYGNAGDGLLDLVFDPRTTEPESPIRQRLYRADATPGRYEPGQDYEQWRAGTAHFHTTHRHWHVSSFYDAQLLKVLPTGEGLDPAHAGRPAVKQGVCTSPWFMLAFDEVLPDEPDVPSTGCDLNELGRPELEEVRIPLAAGWADIYDTIQPDNFVDVTGELPAWIEDELQYVLRFRLNPDATKEVGAGRSPLGDGGFIAESDITNNTAYAHLRITTPVAGQYDVCVLGRGFGDDPWAANAQPVTVGMQECSDDAAGKSRTRAP